MIEGIETETLRESIRSRAAQAVPGAIALYAVLAVLALLLLGQAPAWGLLAWFGPLGLAMGVRLLLARRILQSLDADPAPRLARWDAVLRYSSIVNQAACGAGIWWVGGTSELVAFFVTLTIALFGVGAMINLTSDYRSFRASLPFLMLQPIAYWLVHGGEGLRIALPLAVLSILMLSLVRGSSRTMAESVRMRFEKSELLERVEREREATAQALQVATLAMRARAIFLASASHDLRQPLYAISLLSDALAIEPMSRHGAEVVAKQRQAIAVLRALFDNLLDLSRFDAGEVKPVPRDVSLAEILDPLCNEYEVLCESKGLAWRVQAPSAWVRTDPELVRRLIGNLLSNAVRYTAAGSVALEASHDEAGIRIVVSDTGAGIPVEDRERIFEEFVQLSNPARDRDQGVGLGLSIVRHIAQLLDLRLALESAAGQGTRVAFSIRLGTPVARGVVAPAPRREERDLSGLRVWAVEDDPLVREGLAAHFRAWGVRHAFAADRAGILELLGREGAWPDVAIMDDMLGAGERGLELAEWMAGFVARERIVLVTGNVDPERTRRLEASGFVVLMKPITAQDLGEWIADATVREVA